MNPSEDPTWPTCSAHRPDYWCPDIKLTLTQGLDAEDIVAGSRYCVPVVPDFGAWAEVSIGNGPSERFAQLALVKSHPFTNEEEFIELGYWSEGEGRLSIASVIEDWIKAQIPEIGGLIAHLNCVNSYHSFQDQLRVESGLKNVAFAKANDWSIIISGMCLPCCERASSISSDSFGLTGVTDNSFKDGGLQALRRHNANRT